MYLLTVPQKKNMHLYTYLLTVPQKKRALPLNLKLWYTRAKVLPKTIQHNISTRKQAV